MAYLAYDTANFLQKHKGKRCCIKDDLQPDVEKPFIFPLLVHFAIAQQRLHALCQNLRMQAAFGSLYEWAAVFPAIGSTLSSLDPFPFFLIIWIW